MMTVQQQRQKYARLRQQAMSKHNLTKKDANYLAEGVAQMILGRAVVTIGNGPQARQGLDADAPTPGMWIAGMEDVVSYGWDCEY